MADDRRTVSEAEVGAVLARLREEVRSHPPSNVTAVDASERIRISGRQEAERLWAVTAERGFVRRPGFAGSLKYVAKTVLRKLMRWYVEPAIADQRAFNAATLRLVDELAARAGEEIARAGEEIARAGEEIARARAVEAHAEEQARALKRLATELEERLVRLERRARTAPPPASRPLSSPDAAAPVVPDYFAFEARMRGSLDLVRSRQEIYIEDVRDAAPVLDLGCGRGEFLGLLRDEGIEARGVDSDAEMVAFCRGEGLEVEHADAVAYLGGIHDASLGAVFCAHVVEHLSPGVLVRLLELAAAKIRPGGRLIVETPNPRSLFALRMFFADLTHVRPVDPDTLVMLSRQVGFETAEVRYLQQPTPEERLRQVPLPDDRPFDGARDALEANVDRVNEVVFAPQDYALVARR